MLHKIFNSIVSLFKFHNRRLRVLQLKRALLQQITALFYGEKSGLNIEGAGIGPS
jgi:hypothetical protein